MRIATRTYWGPNPFTTRACVVLRFETLAPSEASILSRSHAVVANYLSEGFGYNPPPAPKDGVAGLASALDFLATASLFILNHVRGDLDVSGYRIVDGTPVLFVEFHHPGLTLRAVQLLLGMIAGFSAEKKESLDTILNRFWDLCQAKHPDFQAHALIAAA